MTQMLRTSIAILAAAAMWSVTPPSAEADDVADFYKGRKVTFVIGYSPGGGYDTYTRMLARHLGKHIPGNPDVIAINMPGGGSLKAANYTYNVAPKDGTYLGVFSAPAAIEPLLGRKNAKYETLKFGWLGNMFRDTHGCAVRGPSKVRTLQDVIEAKEPVIFGASAPSSYGNQHARVLKSMLGANIKIITGYRGIKGVGKALQQGEITAACAMAVSTLKSSFRPQKDSGEFRMIVQFGKERHPYMGDATHFYSMLKNDDDRKTADFFFSQSAIARPVAAPPGVPKDRLAALQRAFQDTLRDPGLLADAKRIGIDVTPETADTVYAAFRDLYAPPPMVLARVKEIMGRK